MPQEPAYRWVIVAAASVILAVTLGQIVNGLSVYFLPLELEFGWSRGDIALINTSGLVGLALGSIVMGFVADRFGTRPVALAGILMIGLATLAATRAYEPWHFYALFFLAGFLGAGALSAPLMALVGSWFARGAGLAIGIAAAGQAVGQGGMPFTGAVLIEALGWRGALAAQGAATLLVCLPLALLLRPAPMAEAGGGSLSTESASGLSNTTVTIWLSAAVVFCCTCMAVPLMHLVPLIQGGGFAAPDAGGVLFFMLMVAITGRIAFGKFADMIGAVPAYLLASAWQTFLVVGFVFLKDITSFYVYAAIYGFGYAGVMTSVLVTARTLTAPARRATSMGIIVAFAYIGHGIGGWQGGFFFDLTGDYTWTYTNAALAGLINLAIAGSLWLTINRRGARLQPA